MRNVTVKCDGCSADLTVRTNMVDYRLVLSSESKPGYGTGVYTAMGIYPSVDRDYHFCGLTCLDHWRGRELHRDQLWREWNKKWQSEHGTKHGSGPGSFTSYPCQPEDVRSARHAEFEAAALTAFPMKHNSDVAREG